jgi:tetratricopeptide (TPR) repeat protein
MVMHRYAAIVIVAIPAIVLLGLTGCGHTSDYYVDRGNALFAEGKYSDAAITYRKAIQKAPASGEAHYRLALAQLAMGYTNDAYQELSRASEILPSRDDVKVEQANVGLAFYVSDPRRPQNLYARLATIAQQLLAKDPNSYDGLRFQGHLAKTDGKLKEAEDYFRRANAVKPLQPNVVVPLVETLFQEKQFSDGERLAQELIQSHKSFLLAYDILYTHYLAQNRFADAESLLKTKLKNNPKDANTVFQLGFHYARLRNETEMRTAVRRILDNPQDFPEGHLQVGEFFATLKNWDEALREFRAGLASAPKSRIVYLKKIASVFIAQGQREAAVQSLEQVLKEQPKERDARTMRALLLLDSSQPEKLRLAESELQDLLRQNGSDAILQYSLGRVQVATGNLEEARNHLQEAIRLRRDYVGPRVELAKIGETTGDYKQVLRSANEILAIDPNNPQARLFRVTGLMGTGNNEQARSELTRLLRDYPQAPGVQLQLGLLDLAEKNLMRRKFCFENFTGLGRTIRDLWKAWYGRPSRGTSTTRL